jgi:two-component system response regulator
MNRRTDFDPIDILIVEDNPQDAELTMRALRKNNLANQIHVAEDGEEALEFVFARGRYAGRMSLKPPKVIFLDLKLPKVSGLEVLKELKNHPDTKKLPVVVVTSSRENPDVQSAYDLGANGYVVKPVEFDDFFEAVAQTGHYWLMVNEPPR